MQKFPTELKMMILEKLSLDELLNKSTNDKTIFHQLILQRIKENNNLIIRKTCNESGCDAECLKDNIWCYLHVNILRPYKPETKQCYELLGHYPILPSYVSIDHQYYIKVWLNDYIYKFDSVLKPGVDIREYIKSSALY